MKMLGSISTRFSLAAVLALSFVTACGDSSGDTDGSVADAAADAGTTTDTGVADTGPRDTGTQNDAGPRDATTQAEYCVQGGIIESAGGDIDLMDEATTVAQNATGNRANVSCIDRGPPTVLTSNIRFEGCLIFAGAPPSLSDLTSGLRASIFYETNPQTQEPVDPSFDFQTGLNRGTPLGVTVEVRENAPQCESGIALELGAEAPGLLTDVVYTIRVRSSTAGGEWMTTYVQGIEARADVAGGGGCTPGTCRYNFNLPLFRRSELQALITASGVNIPGSANLDDGQGPGYAFLFARDCTDSALQHSVVGLNTTAAAAAYLDADFGFDSSLSATSVSGLYAALGLTVTSSLGQTIYGGVGVQRFANECTEGFGLRAFRIYPDSLSLVLFGRETVFNP